MKTQLILLLAIFPALIALTSCRTRELRRTDGVTSPTRMADTMVSSDAPIGEYSPSTLIIMVDSAIGKEPLKAAIKAFGAELIYDYTIIPGVAIRIPEGKTLDESIAYFSKVEGVLSVERDMITHIDDDR